MRARNVVLVVVFAVLAGVGATIGWAVSEAQKQPTSALGGRPPANANQVVTAIGAKWPAPDPRDTTSGCKAGENDAAAGCVGRVTTGSVTVTEYADEATAAKAAKTLRKVGDYRQAGRFVLSWTARDQKMTSDEARADMVRIASEVPQ